MVAAYKFIQKFWSLHKEIVDIKNTKKEKIPQQFDEDLEKFTNQLIKKINLSLDKFSYNVIIANFHETYNYLKKRLSTTSTSMNFIDNYIKIITLMIPVVPHFASECLDDLNYSNEIHWPIVNKEYLKTDEYNIVIQINGKKRGLINTGKEIGEKDLIEKILKMKILKNFIDGKKITKHIYIKNKLINLIIND